MNTPRPSSWRKREKGKGKGKVEGKGKVRSPIAVSWGDAA